MSNVLIRSTLMTALSTWAAAHNPVLTLAREDVPFTKPTGNTPFLEPILIPANTVSVTTSGTRERFMGTFQINIWVKTGLGPNVAEAIVAELEALFPVVPKSYLPVSVETPLSASRAIVDPSGYRVVPCSFTYRLEA